jgi:4-methoxybenzoate monooxygenase (O-demethylating)
LAEAVLKAMIPRVAEIRLDGPVERRLNNTLHAVSRLPVELIPN